MKNVTVSLDDETYRKARLRAAEDERSLSSVVREVLQTYSAPPAEPDHAARLKALWAELDAREPVEGDSRVLTREEMYEEIWAERGRPRT